MVDFQDWFPVEAIAPACGGSSGFVVPRRSPDENGFQFIAGIRKEELSLGGHIPAVAISAYLTANDREVAFRAGFDAFVQKPFELAELSAALDAVMARAGRAVLAPRPI